MHVLINGVRLFFDVEGAKLVPDGPAMREKPTLLLLHGGPGFDHSIYKPAYSALADIAQIIYLDHRGNGRSEDGAREGWNLAQWGDDVHAFCEVLGIISPIVLGASFGGMVALAYATRHPAHPSKLVLISTEAAGGTHRDRAAAGLSALYAHPARSGHGTPRDQPVRGATLVRKTGRRKPHVRYDPGSWPHRMSDPGARWRRRSDAPNRESGGYRSSAASASRSI